MTAEVLVEFSGLLNPHIKVHVILHKTIFDLI